jgi:RimJ/RimL family protein N-acetyltransferase
MDIQPVTLEGFYVRLEPLGLAHEDDLLSTAQPDEIWELLPFNPRQTRGAMHAWLLEAAKEMEAGSKIWFAIIRRLDSRAVGVTSYMDIRPQDRGLEIGGTWLTPEVWRTAVNTECKYLLLRHAFERLGCIRVQLKTDSRNVRSQRAIERLGAVKEGVLRKQMVIRDGYERDTVMYSIVDSEWPAVKRRLEGFLSR